MRQKQKIKVTFFFRHKVSGFFSIEQLFKTIQEYLPENIEINNFYLKKKNTGFLSMVYNVFSVIRNQGDINHITGDAFYIALFLKKKKTLITYHDVSSLYNISSQFKRKIVKLLFLSMPLKRVHHITVISDNTKKEILKECNIKKEKITIIPNCIPPSFLHRKKPFNTVNPRILQVGITENKNIQNLAKAIYNIQCHLRIIGKPDIKLIQLMESLSIDYSYAHNLSMEEVINEYKNADLLAFVSKSEGFGLPILEAQSIGLPVITSNISPMTEAAGEGAYFVDPFNINSINEGIKKVIEEPKLRERLIKKGAQNVLKYSPKQIADSYVKVYEKMLLK